jgi:two-component system, chemotaxis family, response regulator Rcp1
MDKELPAWMILIIEHNAQHADVIRETLKLSSLHHEVHVIQNGTAAIEYLKQSSEDPKAQLPNLIFLNLDLPDRDGQELLAELKADARFRRIPIVVLNNSNDELDVFKSYELQGNCYVVKTADAEQLPEIIKKIKKFWLEIVTLPLE